MGLIAIKPVMAICVACTVWGLSGIYYYQLSHISALEVLAHRSLWALVFFSGFLLYKGQLVRLIKSFMSIRELALHSASTLLICVNWFSFIFALQSGQAVQASFGYYIFPIFSVFLGRVFLKEKINRNKIIAIILVFISIIYLLIEFKSIPWIGLTVAITFSLYTLIRKKINISSDLGLFFETLLISPMAIILFFTLVLKQNNIFGFSNPDLSFYLFFAGFMTLIPLFMYIKGFELIGIGPASMIFFLTPTAQFFLSIFYLDQALNIEKLISFVFIWIAVLIYLNELRKE